MGSGTYSVSSRALRAESMGYMEKSASEIFTQRQINHSMNPWGVLVRESLDTPEHPNTVPIVLALDVTGSMGSIPHHLVKEGLPKIMGTIIQRGIADPQLMFLAIGDHECDESPLQVGQFESSDELLDKWLTSVYLEGGGGGNEGESYLLAWYFAANHTKIDSFDKRGKKGFLFTIGDEPTLRSVPGKIIKEIMGSGQYDRNNEASVLLDKARERYEVFHIHVANTRASFLRINTVNDWKQLIGEGLIIVNDYKEIPSVIADTVYKMRGRDEYAASNGVVIEPSVTVIPGSNLGDDTMML